MQCTPPICILCLRDCDSSGCLSSCNHFFCARCVPRLPPANPPSSPPTCPVCKKAYRLVSVNSTAVQPLLQDQAQLLRLLSSQHGHQRQVILRMKDALRVLKEEVKSIDAKYRAKSAALDHALRTNQQQQQQYVLQQQQQQQSRMAQSQPQIMLPMPQQQQQQQHSQTYQQPQQPMGSMSTPRGQSCASPFSLGPFFNSAGGGGGGVMGSADRPNPFATPQGGGTGRLIQQQPQYPHHQQQLQQPSLARPSQPATPLSATLAPAPLGWSVTSGVFLNGNNSAINTGSNSGRLSHGGGGADGGLNTSNGGTTAAVAPSAAPHHHQQQQQLVCKATANGSFGDAMKRAGPQPFRLSTPLDRSTATPDLLWPR